jgi:hypothetical protein
MEDTAQDVRIAISADPAAIGSYAVDRSAATSERHP